MGHYITQPLEAQEILCKGRIQESEDEEFSGMMSSGHGLAVVLELTAAVQDRACQHSIVDERGLLRTHPSSRSYW